MARTTIGCDESVKQRVENLKGDYQSWDALLVELAECYEATNSGEQ